MQFCDVDAQWDVQHAILRYGGTMSHATCKSVLWKRDGDVHHAILRYGGARKRAACNSEMWKGNETQEMDFYAMTT